KCKELGISSDCKYFNAGVLVINLKKWRAENMSEKVIEYVIKNPKFILWADQDGLNPVLAGKWNMLNPRWNQQSSIHDFSFWKDSPFSEEMYNDVVHHPYIIHFSAPYKPWNSLKAHPSKHLFFQYLDMTAWSGWRLTIWRRIQRRLIREMKQLKNFVSLPSTQVQNRKA
ncbi:MAG: hypothetical protein JO235_15515, partial [Chroococcidiopsidaceae cyanobacterium CP_BM_RX_35]|nr:hypothetical protein [Chroococcidiopsidaceae cyanobacterium CP_BM_RX_35]